MVIGGPAGEQWSQLQQTRSHHRDLLFMKEANLRCEIAHGKLIILLPHFPNISPASSCTSPVSPSALLEKLTCLDWVDRLLQKDAIARRAR